MIQSFEKTTEQALAFQKMWLESTSKLFQAAFTFSPGSPPPEVMRQVRSSIFQALGESWEQFMRTPEFTNGMKTWLDNAVTARKMSNEFMAKVRNEMQAPSRDDIDTVMLTVRHLEKRLLDRLEELSEEVAGLKQQVAVASAPRTSRRPAPGGPSRPSRRKTAKTTVRATYNGKETTP